MDRANDNGSGDREALGGSEVLWTADPQAPRLGTGNRLIAGNSPKEGQGDGRKEKDEPPKKPLYKRPLLMTIILAVVLISAIAATAYFIHSRHFLSTDDAFIESHIIQIGPKVSGIVADVRINDNWLVKRGQVLVTLDARDYQSSLAQAQANRAAMAGKLEQARSGKKVSEANVAQAQAEVDVAQINYENAKRDFDRYTSLDERARSKQQLDNATAGERAANAQVTQAKARVSEMLAQQANADSTIKTAEADLARVEADVHQAELNVGYCTIVAPEDGYITNRSVEPGAYVQVGQALFAIVSKNAWVVANFKETQLESIRAGQPVSIRVDAFPDKTFHGHVDSIMAGAGARFSLLPPENATGNYVKVVQRVPVKIDIDPSELGDPQYILGPGMSVVPEIDVRNGQH